MANEIIRLGAVFCHSCVVYSSKAHVSVIQDQFRGGKYASVIIVTALHCDILVWTGQDADTINKKIEDLKSIKKGMFTQPQELIHRRPEGAAACRPDYSGPAMKYDEHPFT